MDIPMIQKQLDKLREEVSQIFLEEYVVALVSVVSKAIEKENNNEDRRNVHEDSRDSRQDS